MATHSFLLRFSQESYGNMKPTSRYNWYDGIWWWFPTWGTLSHHSSTWLVENEKGMVIHGAPWRTLIWRATIERHGSKHYSNTWISKKVKSDLNHRTLHTSRPVNLFLHQFVFRIFDPSSYWSHVVRAWGACWGSVHHAGNWDPRRPFFFGENTPEINGI